jgi:uncharacterized iron-regulated protein
MSLFRILTLICLTGIIAMEIAGQAEYNEGHFRVYDGRGNASSVDAIIEAAGGADAVFLGELHDDAVGHAVQMEIFKRALAKYGSDRKMGLSLEMFERDVQIVIDEYLAGLIREDHFLLSSRPWGNYKTDYRPLVELARERRLPVIAANAPRRYINMVSRNGRGALDRLSKDARKWLAPLPYAEPSAAYAAKFRGLMGPSSEARMGLDNILASQALWDATMADAVARFVKKYKNPLVIHLNGGFHTESRLGTVEHFLKYRSKAKALVVTMRYEENFQNFDPAKHTGLGDFVVLTDAKQPRSKR